MRVIGHIRSQRQEYGVVLPLDLAITFRMVGGRKVILIDTVRHKSMKNLDVEQLSLTGMSSLGGTQLNTQVVTKHFAILEAEMPCICAILIIFVKRSVVARRHSLWCGVRKNTPSLSMYTGANDAFSEKTWSSVTFLSRLVRLRVQCGQLHTVELKSIDHAGQLKKHLIL